MASVTAFALFPTLPIELRLRIWKAAAPRFVFLVKNGRFKASLLWRTCASINACKESRLATPAISHGSRNHAFDASRDILVLSYKDIHLITRSSSHHKKKYGKAFYFCNEAFGNDIRPFLQKIELYQDVSSDHGPRSSYKQFSKYMIRILRRCPAMKSIGVGLLRDNGLSSSMLIAGSTSARKYAAIRTATVNKIKASIEEAMKKEKLRRKDWKAPSFRWSQLWVLGRDIDVEAA